VYELNTAIIESLKEAGGGAELVSVSSDRATGSTGVLSVGSACENTGQQILTNKTKTAIVFTR
jgi:hypothetical protein